jgi:hypothetical protein
MIYICTKLGMFPIESLHLGVTTAFSEIFQVLSSAIFSRKHFKKAI